VIGTFNGPTDIGGPQPFAGPPSDIFLLALAEDGTVGYVKVYGGSGAETPSGVAVDPAGTVFASGSFSDSVDFGGGARMGVGTGDVFVVSLTVTGAHRFDRVFGTAAFETPDRLARDEAGDVHLYGRFSTGIDFGGGARSVDDPLPTDAFEVVLGPSLEYRYDVQYREVVDLVVRDVAFDAAGNQYQVGNVIEDHNFGGGVVPSTMVGAAYVASYGPRGLYRFADIYFPDMPVTQTYGNGVDIGPAGDLWVGGILGGSSIDFGGGSEPTMGWGGFLLHLRD
jgi:hypothetical protein